MCTLLTVVCLLSSSRLDAQVDQALFDSLLTVSATMPADTEKVNLLTKLGLSARKFDATQAEVLAREALQISESLKYEPGIGNAYNILGLLQYYQGNYDEALDFQFKSLEAKIRSGDSLKISVAYNDIANIYAEKGDLKEAVNYYKMALELAEAESNDKMITKLLGNIGTIFHEQEDYDNALQYYRQCLDRSDTSNSEYWQTIFVIEANIGFIKKKQGKLDEALKYFESSLVWREKVGYIRGIAQMHASIGEVLIMMGNKVEGRERLIMGLQMQRELNDNYGATASLGTLGDLALEEGQYDDALSYYKEALEGARETGSLQLLRDTYEGLALAYAGVGNFKEAYAYQYDYQLLKDSILNLETNELIADLRTKYETEQKEQEIENQKLIIEEQQRRNKLQLIVFVLSVVFIVVLAGLLYNRYKLRQQAAMERTIAEEQKLRFRAVIEAQEQERKRIAQELHDGLGQLLSTARLNVASLEDEASTFDADDSRAWGNSLELIDEAVSEVRNISHNMMPSALIRLGLVPAIREQVRKINTAGVVQVDLEVEGMNNRLAEGTEIALYRIIQEVLNNTIKHAKAERITVSLSQKNDGIHLDITDNGRGMEQTAVANSKGIGWRNIFSRVELLNGHINLRTAPGQGTSIQVQVPAA